ncbi:YeeE/YedE family protein [Roseivivax isoporae]|uniref:YeeE/YedE family protein n=1 Tax=Roseivivax isoporae LMG 25204 TaxID=1449351 RepID=X7F2W1_9RHOB|nr:YeeE/YedE thiosulfate transporter family protein [Roseivivax isoporae]ETX27262.1 YeeE/YedE family protein [Roseivivax isoporae LMG 25204]
MELSVVTPFTPLASLAGGVLIGLSAVLLMALYGRIAGISGITAGGLLPAGTPAPDRGWRVAFVAGIVLAPLAFGAVTGALPTQTVPSAPLAMALAGLAVGLGTALGSGCTSGHGVCGLARLSPRSLVAVLTFMVTAGVTVFVLRHLI